MKSKSLFAFALFVLSSIIILSSFKRIIPKPTPSPVVQTPPNPNETPSQSKIQVVFALDATGSMSGLINAAKEKIWSIAGSMTQAEQAPQIEVGLIFYRDRGDEFVTNIVPFSNNLDDIYEKLMQIQAQGGGDLPESVNQALHESVTKFKWDNDQSYTYKSIFLVGDCPPHMDYPNDIKYLTTCEQAKQKDIFLNTILMGNNGQAKKIWNEIANYNQGSFTQVDMNANDISISTPYDDSISTLSDKLDNMRYYYGDKSVKAISKSKKLKSESIAVSASKNAKAQRAEYNTSKTGEAAYMGSNELLSDVKANKVKLENLKEDEIPDELQAVPAAQRSVYIETKLKEKESTQKQMNDYIIKRQQYISEELSKKNAKDVDNSFNSVIYEKIKIQSSKKNIKLNGKAKF